jgi:hypothetical protein
MVIIVLNLTRLRDGMIFIPDIHIYYKFPNVQYQSDFCNYDFIKLYKLASPQAAQSYPVLLITLYLYINSILKIIRKSCVINLLRYILYRYNFQPETLCMVLSETAT